MCKMCLDLCWRYESIQLWFLLSRISLVVKGRLTYLRQADTNLWDMTISAVENSRRPLRAKLVQEGIMEERRHLCTYFMLHSCQHFIFLHLEVFTCTTDPTQCSSEKDDAFDAIWSQVSCFLFFSLFPNRTCFSLIHVYWVPLWVWGTEPEAWNKKILSDGTAAT